jgi:UDP-N-acetylglucosamine 2-epimerase (non-hydrolysing)
MKKNLIIFGTRPEAIKMAPLVKEFLKNMKDFKPDYVYVHGDTTTTMAASIAAFYSGAIVCHVEAGLRTFDMKSPFPEEMNRSVTGVVTNIHFAPTSTARKNLIIENKKEESIVVTGNTVIDALLYSVKKVNSSDYNDQEIEDLKKLINPKKRLILVTGHRRENHGQGFISICKALKTVAEEHSDCQIIYPVHLNPNVQKPVYKLLGSIKNINLISPLSYPAFVWLMEKSYLIITDSGGVQEEAPSLGKPVLVMRNTTERPEAVEAGTVLLVGTNANKIIEETKKLLTHQDSYTSMSKLHNPYGDGTACKKIVNYIKSI